MSLRIQHATLTTLLVAIPLALSAQTPRVIPADERTLRDYAGAYQWDEDVFLYVQVWSELTGKHQLVARAGP